MGVTIWPGDGLAVPSSVVPPFAIMHGGEHHPGCNITYNVNPKEMVNIELRTRKKTTDVRAKPVVLLAGGRLQMLLCAFGPVLDISGPGLQKDQEVMHKPVDVRDLLGA